VKNKPRIWILRLADGVRSVLSRGLPTWREKVSLGFIIFAMLIVAAALLPGSDLRRPIQTDSAYWQKPLTCSGPDFREPPPDPDSAPDEPRAIFRMSDQVVRRLSDVPGGHFVRGRCPVRGTVGRRSPLTALDTSPRNRFVFPTREFACRAVPSEQCNAHCLAGAFLDSLRA
jgi:hypothetical protein